MANVYQKQNDRNNLRYLWAAEYCSTKKRRIMYLQVFLSFLMPVFSIVNKFLAVLFPNIQNLQQVSALLSEIIVLLSGCVIILQIVFNIAIKRWDKQSVTLIELYDINVFSLFANKAIMINISHQRMLNFAEKFKKHDRVRNYYFDTPEEAENKYAHFNAIKKRFELDYYNMLAVKSFLYALWLAFIALLVIFAFAINPTWTEAVMYIFVPSLSAISIIAQTWNEFNVKINYLEKVLQTIAEYDKKKDDPANLEGLNSRIVMRSLQDAMFIHRLNDFTIPNFILKRIEKKKRMEMGAQYIDSKVNNAPVKAAEPVPAPSPLSTTQHKSVLHALKAYYDEARAEKMKKETVATVNEVKTPVAEKKTNGKKETITTDPIKDNAAKNGKTINSESKKSKKTEEKAPAAATGAKNGVKAAESPIDKKAKPAEKATIKPGEKAADTKSANKGAEVKSADKKAGEKVSDVKATDKKAASKAVEVKSTDKNAVNKAAAATSDKKPTESEKKPVQNASASKTPVAKANKAEKADTKDKAAITATTAKAQTKLV